MEFKTDQLWKGTPVPWLQRDENRALKLMFQRITGGNVTIRFCKGIERTVLLGSSGSENDRVLQGFIAKKGIVPF